MHSDYNNIVVLIGWCCLAVRSLDESDRYLKFALTLLDHIRMVRLNKEVSVCTNKRWIHYSLSYAYNT